MASEIIYIYSIYLISDRSEIYKESKHFYIFQYTGQMLRCLKLKLIDTFDVYLVCVTLCRGDHYDIEIAIYLYFNFLLNFKTKY